MREAICGVSLSREAVRYRDLMRKWSAMGVGGETVSDIDEMNSQLASVQAIRQELASSRG